MRADELIANSVAAQKSFVSCFTDWMLLLPTQIRFNDNVIEMIGAAVCAVLLAALVSPSQEHAIGNANCGLKFQERIKAAIAIKRECASALFDDCCQVHKSLHN